jgi:hypothetical protein
LNDFYIIFGTRIADLKTNHPGNGWDGVYEARTK